MMRFLLTIFALWVAQCSAQEQVVREISVKGKVHLIPGDKSYERNRSYNTDEFHFLNNGILEVHTVNYDGDVPTSYVKQAVAFSNLNLKSSEVVYMEDDPVMPFKGALLYIDFTKKFAKKQKDAKYISLLFESKELAEQFLEKLKQELQIKITKNKNQ